MPKSGVEAYIYLDFYSDEIYTEDEINKITGVDCSKATFESPLQKMLKILGIVFSLFFQKFTTPIGLNLSLVVI